MLTIQTLFNTASQLARRYNGSEQTYRDFTEAAIAFEQAGGKRHVVDELISASIAAFYSVHDFLDQLQSGGALIIEQEHIFVEPDEKVVTLEKGETPYRGPIYDSRLQDVIRVLLQNEIFFDDLVIDAGLVAKNQMRKWPYVIIGIPRMNSQIAVANQYGEAMFIANPAIEIDQWKSFKKDDLNKPGCISNIKRVTFAGEWQRQMLDAVFRTQREPGPKVVLTEYIEQREQPKLTVMESAIVAMAKLYRERHPSRQWPTPGSGEIDADIAKLINGDVQRRETWKNIDNLARIGGRGLPKGQSLSQILKKNSCSYAVTERQIAEMGWRTRDRLPHKRWPSQISGQLDHDIVAAVTGDPHWQAETWDNFRRLLIQGGRGLPGGKTLAQLFDEHFPAERTRKTLRSRPPLGPII